jgi:hypothetical protein
VDLAKAFSEGKVDASQDPAADLEAGGPGGAAGVAVHGWSLL